MEQPRWEDEINPLPMSLPLTISGRSPFDGVRIRWGGLGAVGLGVGLLCTAEPVGILFGAALLGLGLATWIMSGFGTTWWYDIPTPRRYIVGTGAIAGMLIVIFFVGGVMLAAWLVQMFASNR